MKDLKDIFRQITLLSQLGLSVLMPLLICLGLCAWLVNKNVIGGWIFIPGFIMGLGSSFMTAYKFYTAVIRKDEKDTKRKDKVSFNNHI